MTAKRVVPVIGVTVMLIFCWAALSYGEPQAGDQSPPPAAAPNPPLKPAQGPETFEFKGKTFVYDDWYGVFCDGKQVGWVHMTLNSVARGELKAFLYEATEHLEFAADKVRDTDVKALFGEVYNPIAYKRIDQVGDVKNELYVGAVFSGGKAQGFVARQTIGDKTTETQLGLGGGLAMFDFSVPYYIRSGQAATPIPGQPGGAKGMEYRGIIDLPSCNVVTTRLTATPLKQEKIAGADVKVRTVDIGSKIYYFDENLTPVFVVDTVRNLHMIRSGEVDAKTKDRPEPGYTADPKVNGSLYDDKADGFQLKRPDVDWSMSVISEGAMPVIRMMGLVSGGSAFGLVLPGLPAGTSMTEAGARLRQFAKARLEKDSALKIELGDVKPVPQAQPGYAREDCPVKASSGILSFEGDCAVIMNGNVAFVLVYLVSAGTLEQNKNEMNRFFDDVRLTPVDAAKKPVYQNKAKGFKIEFPGRLWGFVETDTGLTITNPWLGAYGQITVQNVPKEAKLDDFAAGVVQNARNLGNIVDDENGVAIKLGGQDGRDSQDGKLFMLSGPMPQTGELARSRLYVTINNGMGYAIWISLPDSAYNMNAAMIDTLINGFKFVKP